MSAFAPSRQLTLTISASTYRFMPHPIFTEDMDEVYVIEGGEALIYQVQELGSGALYALKVMKPAYRGEHIARAVATLARYATIAGLSLDRRICLTQTICPHIIGVYPDLQYAVLAPWLAGRTWAGVLLDADARREYTARHALSLAQATAKVLWDLEAHHLAHTDIAGANTVLTPAFNHIEMLDVENLYVPNTPPPVRVSRGTPGYQHRRLGDEGQWRPDGDRFAGAILLAEMLAWSDPLVRAQTPEGSESLFQPGELQETTSPRWQAVRDALWAICPPTLQLFDQAWASVTLADCPELSSWAVALVQATQG